VFAGGEPWSPSSPAWMSSLLRLVPVQSHTHLPADHDAEGRVGRAAVERGVLREAVFDGERFQCMDFDHVIFEDVTFLGCDLRGSDFSTCSFSHVIMYKCHTYGAIFPRGQSPIFIECEERLASG